MPVKQLRFEPLPASVREVIGVGVSFPFTFSSRGRSRQLDTIGGAEKINQAIHQILSTRPGERIFVPEFGSKLPDLVFEPEDDVLYDQLYYYTVAALQRWEPRIEIVNVTIITSDALQQQFNLSTSTVGIQIAYSILSLHVTGSYVYPFQLGGMPLSDTITT